MAKKKPAPVVEDVAEEPPTSEELTGVKEPRVYKGEETEITAIEAGDIVQTLPGARKGKYDAKLPLFMMVESVTPYTTKTKYVTYLDPRNGFRRGGVEVDDTFKVNNLTGRMRSDLQKELHAYKMANIGTQLRWPGGYLGTDPEVFVVDKAGAIIPAFNFLGSKKKPNQVQGVSGTVYWDGFQAEFTTEATNCLQQQTDRIAYGLQTLYTLMKAHNKDAELSISSVLPVPDGLLESSKPEHVEFGCAPSINVYGLKGNTADGRVTPIRFAGGHLHLGIMSALAYNNNSAAVMAKYPAAIKALDAILGVGCVSMFEGYDIAARRQFYGLAGEYRTPPHGIEYRTLSNAWLIHPMITNVVFEVARRAVALGWEGLLPEWNAPEEETIDIINSNDVAGARKVFKRNEKLFKALMSTHVFANSIEKLWALFTEGMGNFLKHPRDIAANWGLRPEGHTKWKYVCANWGHCNPTLPKKV